MTENYEPTHREKYARADIEKDRAKDELEEMKKEDSLGIFEEDLEERYAEAQEKLDKLMAEGHEEALELKKEHERLKRELEYVQKFRREIDDPRTTDPDRYDPDFEASPEVIKACEDCFKAFKELDDFEVSKLGLPRRIELKEGKLIINRDVIKPEEKEKPVE